MTKVDFYILPGADIDSRLRTACRIAEKAFSKKLATHIHMDYEDETESMNDLLWTFRDRSFVPHTTGCQRSDDLEVTIAHAEVPEQSDVLINLAREVPVFFSQFERVVEIIDQDTSTRDCGRERYRFYRDRGYPLTHHQL